MVAAALFDAAGRVLVQQRPQGSTMAGLWEFPGGKVEPSEAPVAALIRELHEELGIIISTATPLAFVEDHVGDSHLLLLLYTCCEWQGTPAALHASSLQWVMPTELYTLAMPPADFPLIASVVAAAQRIVQ